MTNQTIAAAATSTVEGKQHDMKTRAAELNASEVSLAWQKPDYKDLRYGFEINMYVLNR